MSPKISIYVGISYYFIASIIVNKILAVEAIAAHGPAGPVLNALNKNANPEQFKMLPIVEIRNK